MPAKYLPFQQGIKDIHPTFRYELWDELRIAALIKKDHRWFYETWNSLPFMIQKIDSAKIAILCSYGGIYLDLDMEAIRSIEPLLTAPLVLSRCYVHPFATGMAKFLGLPYFSETHVNNAFIACTKRHPVMIQTMLFMYERVWTTKNIIYSIYIAKVKLDGFQGI